MRSISCFYLALGTFSGHIHTSPFHLQTQSAPRNSHAIRFPGASVCLERTQSSFSYPYILIASGTGASGSLPLLFISKQATSEPSSSSPISSSLSHHKSFPNRSYSRHWACQARCIS